MTPEEKVLNDIKDKIETLFSKINELKVTEAERNIFEEEKRVFQLRIDDYKKHKKSLEDHLLKQEKLDG